MAKRKRTLDQEVIVRRRNEGRGIGRGALYKPWLRIQDVPSHGLVTRIRGWKTGRIHHLMSNLELRYFFTLEWALNVIDIREQYPLDLDETIAVAKELGIAHPLYRPTKHPVVMTTDFVVTVTGAHGFIDLARTTKYVEQLHKRRVAEKFEVERMTWALRAIDWGIITERDIDFILAENVRWVHPYRGISRYQGLTEDCVVMVEKLLGPRLMEGKTALSDLAGECDRRLGLEVGMSLKVVRHLIANRRIQTDMSTLIEPKRILPLSAVPAIML
jgi:TnsA-like endonuclease N terminal/TnsA endonuclease C terminal